MADGSVKIDTRLDNSKISQDLKELENQLKSGAIDASSKYGKEISKLSSAWNKASQRQSEANSKLKEYQGGLGQLESFDMKIEGLKFDKDSLQNEITEMNQAMQNGTVSTSDFTAKLSENQAKVNELNEQIKQLSNEADKINVSKLEEGLERSKSKAQEATLQMDTIGKNASNLKTKIEDIVPPTEELANKTAKANREMSKAPKSADNLNKGLHKGIKTLMKYAMALVGVRAIYGGIQKATNAWMQSTQEGAQAQADLQHIWASLGQTLAPVIQWLIAQLQTILGYANAIAKAFFGFELFSKRTNKNLGGAAKQAKKIRKELAGFDEMNILGANGQQNAAGGGGGITPTEIGTPDISGFKNAIDKIKKWLDDLWNSDIVQSYWNSIATITKNTVDMIKSITLNIWDNIKLSFDEMLPFLLIGFNNMIEYWRRVLEDMAIASTKWFPIITQSINEFIDSVFNTFRPFTTLIARIWSEMTQMLLDSWNKYGADILDAIGEFVNGIVDSFRLIWDLVIDPIVMVFLNELIRLWDVYLKDIVADVVDFVYQITLRFLEVWNNAIKPFIDKMVEIFGPVLVGVFDLLAMWSGSVLEGLIIAFKQAWDAVKMILNGILDFIEGVFTGNWSKAWEGLSWIIEGVFTGLGAFVKAPLNAIIGMVNGLIRGLNKIKLPSFLGGGGVNLPTIPFLAKGGITTGATTAVIGEAGREAVIPLQNNTDWIHDFLALANENGGIGNGEQQIVNIIQIDGDEVKRSIRKSDEDEQFRNGGLSYGI